MFDYIEGTLAEKGPGYAVVGTKGLGFRVEVPITLCDELALGEQVKLFTYFILARSELPVLYGFRSPEQRKLFHSIVAVSGIGPRLAINLLGCFDTAELAEIVAAKDAARLARVPKLGPKKARLLLLELEGKLPLIAAGTAGAKPAEMQPAQEAVQALISLGYKVKEAQAAIETLNQPENSSEQLVRQALQNLTKRGAN